MAKKISAKSNGSRVPFKIDSEGKIEDIRFVDASQLSAVRLKNDNILYFVEEEDS